MNAREQAGSEEVRFEDLDLVYIFSFDLGAPVEAEDLKKLLEWFSNSERYKIVEGIPSGVVGRPTPQFVYRKAKELEIEDAEKISIEELMKNEKLREEIDRALAMFRAILWADFDACSSEYLKLGRYARLKLIDLNLSIKDKELSYLNELKYELYLLLHSVGVGVLTAWIHLNGNFSTDDVIKIGEELDDVRCTIKGPLGDIRERKLHRFIYQKIIEPLQVAVLFKGKYGSYDAAFDALKRGDITEDKIKLRTSYIPVRAVLCIRKHRCNGKCATAEEAVERHLREIAGISRLGKGWKYSREDVAKKDLGENLSLNVDHAIFVSSAVSLFLGSTMLDERLKSVKDKELVYRLIEFLLVQPMEFLSLSDMILRVYTSVYRNKFKEIRERRRRGETVKPSEVVEIREGLMEGLEEYNDVSLFMTYPNRKIMEYGKERLRLSDKVNVLKSLLEELDGMSRTLYEEETLREHINLSRKQVLLTILFGIFGAFQALAYFEPKIGFLYALAVTSAILLLSYLFYELYPYIIRKLHLFKRRKAG
jgi:hypothetical protein